MHEVRIHGRGGQGWRFPSSMTTEVCRMQVRTNFIALWEYDPANGLRFTHPVVRPEPVANYLKLIGKYKHLSEEQIAHIQRTVDEKILYLQQMAQIAEARAISLTS